MSNTNVSKPWSHILSVVVLELQYTAINFVLIYFKEQFLVVKNRIKHFLIIASGLYKLKIEYRWYSKF